ncbi:hypothetical protein [Rhizobium oryzicola]|uniref:TnsA endonuclease N-terminal domain-containing protein n=1 Tax=Rhizobium oryzicola TaxID=1232668 RepID=A0ABT8SYR6_9HYPH|nr:hypothetical protein [Rhizobium oryzicola]MDO1583620.1 hypothetical protein [Rhizobium oryzicola]
MRRPPDTHGRTLRGFSIFNETVVYHESDLERRVSTVLQLRKDVRKIYSQYPVLLYRDADGEIREHICDYSVVFDGGEMVAVVVKHARKEAAMRDMIDRVRALGFLKKSKSGIIAPAAVGDIRLLTERHATYGAFERAGRILRARRMRDDAEYARTLAIVRNLGGQFKFGELLRGCPDRAARRTAVLLLIDDLVLVTEGSGSIDDLTMLRVANSGAAQPATPHFSTKGIDHAA